MPIEDLEDASVSHPDGLPDLFLDRSLGPIQVPRLLAHPPERVRLPNAPSARRQGRPARRPRPVAGGGLPTIRDTRVTVGMVLGQLAAGQTIDDVLEAYPYLERDDVLAALEYAAAAVNEREVPVARPA